MNRQVLMNLKFTLYDELEKIAVKGDISSGELKTVGEIVDVIKDLCEILKSDNYENEASGRYYYPMMDRYSYADGRTNGGNNSNSYGQDREYYIRTGYSRESGKEAMLNRIMNMMHESNDPNDKMILQQTYDRLKSSY